MRTVQVTETAVSIWFSHEAVPGRGQLLALVRQALTEQGLPPWSQTEAECFAAGEDALVIARPGRAHQAAFYFDDLEMLLGGVLATAEGESSLYAAEDGYILIVAPEAAGPALYEYGQPWQIDADWEHHAEEQGRCLIERSAISDLRRCFLR